MSVAHAIAYVVIVAAGVSMALQQVLNSNLSTHLGSPWWAGFTSYFVGMAAMLIVAVIGSGARLPSLTTSGSWLIWTGGFFGALFIVIAIFMVPRLGAATVLALMVVGQLLGSIVFDHFGLLGLPHHPATFIRLAGALLLLLGVILIRM